MGRRVNTAWFSQYRAAAAELPTAMANGELRGEVLLRHTRLAGVKDETFARLMKAGRALDGLAPQLPLEQVQCSYMQADCLGKIAQLSLARAEALLPAVLRNECSLEQLKSTLLELQQAQPDTASLHNRDSIQRRILAHERQCTEALARVGAAFFGVPGGRILRQTGSSLYQAPHFLVTHNATPQAALFVRIGGLSKSATAVSLDFLQVALAHRALVPRIWFLLPRASPVIATLTRLITQVGAAPHQDNWLNIAILDPDSGQLDVQSEDAYQTLAAWSVLEHDASDLRWAGRDIVSGEETSLDYFAALQSRATVS